MKIIVCTADNNGILFNNRRVSKDKAVLEDIVKNTPELILSDYSRKMFEGYNVTESDNGYLFLESDDLDMNCIDEVIAYKWNRDYPADTFFVIDTEKFVLVESSEFAGNSHERITKEKWKRN